MDSSNIQAKVFSPSLFACTFDDLSRKSYVYWTISLMSNIRIYVHQSINPSKIEDLIDQKIS